MRVQTLVLCASLAVPAAIDAEVLTIDREKVLYKDMVVDTLPNPLVSSPGAGGAPAWSTTVVHGSATPALRVHVEIRSRPAASDWRIRFSDSSGQEVESIAGDSPLIEGEGFWSGEIPGREATIELVSDTNRGDLVIAIDRYAHRVLSPIPKSISGPDQRTPIRRAPSEVRAWAGPVARLRFISEGGQFVCTGFLLTNDLLMTNAHCLGTQEAALSAIADFGFDTAQAVPTTSRVRKLEAADEPLDYALVRLDRSRAEFGHVALATETARDQQALVVIEHPAGEFKQASLDDCVVAGAAKAGVTASPTDFGHKCDTLGGSSGSPVMDRQTGRVVGLHHLGFMANDPNPVNQAVHIGLVLKDVQGKAPGARSEIAAAQR